MKTTFYPFELHCHTVHSDGKMTPDTLIEAAVQDGLTGVALTDHNAVSGLDEAERIAGRKGVVFLRGTEWTTFYGHITVLGAESVVDWRSVNPDSVVECVRNVRASGGIAGIAHPYRIGYPICTGGSDDWGLGNDYGAFSHYEVWSYLSPQKNPTNRMAKNRYYELIAAGNRLACVYGRDRHTDYDEGKAYAVTFVGVEGAPDARSVYQAIARGRTYVSTGVTVDLALEREGTTYEIGSEVACGECRLRIGASLWRKAYTDRFGVSIDGVRLLTEEGERFFPIKAEERAEIPLSLSGRYLGVEVEGTIEGERGTLAVVTPFFVKS